MLLYKLYFLFIKNSLKNTSASLINGLACSRLLQSYLQKGIGVEDLGPLTAALSFYFAIYTSVMLS